MSKKKRLLTITAICITLIVSVILSMSNSVSPLETEDTQPINTSTIPGESMFVIPEIPVGTLGVISALAMALIIFASVKKRK